MIFNKVLIFSFGVFVFEVNASQSFPNVPHSSKKGMLGSLSGKIQHYFPSSEKKKIKILNQFMPVVKNKYCFTLEGGNSNQFTFHFLHEDQVDTVFANEQTKISRIITQLYTLIFTKKISDALIRGDKAQAMALAHTGGGEKRVQAAKDFVSYIEKNKQNLQELLPYNYNRLKLIENIERDRYQTVQRTINWAKNHKVGIEAYINALNRARDSWAHQYDTINDRFSAPEMLALRVSIIHYARKIAAQIIDSYDVQWTNDPEMMGTLVLQAGQSAMNAQSQGLQCVPDDESVEVVGAHITPDLPAIENIEDVIDFDKLHKKK